MSTYPIWTHISTFTLGTNLTCIRLNWSCIDPLSTVSTFCASQMQLPIPTSGTRSWCYLKNTRTQYQKYIFHPIVSLLTQPTVIQPLVRRFIPFSINPSSLSALILHRYRWHIVNRPARSHFALTSGRSRTGLVISKLFCSMSLLD